MFRIFSKIKCLFNILSEAVLLVKSSHKSCHVENKPYLVCFDKYTVNLMFL